MTEASIDTKNLKEAIGRVLMDASANTALVSGLRKYRGRGEGEALQLAHRVEAYSEKLCNIVLDTLNDLSGADFSSPGHIERLARSFTEIEFIEREAITLPNDVAAWQLNFPPA